MIVLELTDDEALSLRNLLDLAVKAGGMRAAVFAVQLDNKILALARANAEQKNNGGADERPAL